MSKKILSALLVLTLLVTSVCFMGIGVSAEETAWAVGDRPYAVAGGRQEPIVVSADEGEFYDDFVVPNNFIFENFQSIIEKSFQLNNGNNAVATTSAGVVIASTELSTADENGVNENAYGGAGNSVKVQTGALNNVAKPLADGTRAHYNSVRTNATINLTTEFPSLDDIAISFWVKTEGPAQYSAAFWDTTTTTGQKLHSDAVNLPAAGEYIVTIPLQNFYLSNAAYKKATSISEFKVFGLEIMFKAASVEADEMLTMYIDNIGLYAVMPNYGAAEHTAAAVIKDNMDDYTDSETSVKEVTVPDNKGVWVTGNSYATSLRTVERNNGKALCYTATDYKYCATGLTTKNTMTASSAAYTIDFAGKDDVNLGKDGTLAIWVKVSRATRFTVSTNNNSGSAWLSSDEIVVPAGESIIKIPLSVYYNKDASFKQIKKMQINFCCIAPQTNTIGGKTGTFMIDDIAIEPTVVAGDTNGDKVCDAIDIVRVKKVVAAAKTYEEVPSADIYPDKKLNVYDALVLRNFLLGSISSLPENAALIEEDSFVEIVPNSAKWEISTTDTLTLTQGNTAHYYPESNDTDAVKVNYSSLASNSGNKFYYNASFNAPYNSDSVFCFWVYSEQSVNLRYSYMDYSNTDSKSIQCKWVTKTIPAGESIVELPMSELAPDGKDMAYRSAFQFQINIWSNNASTSTDGVLYLDNFGFYDKDTTNDIPAVAE